MPANLVPSHDHFISLDRAKEMTRLYRENKETILSPEFQGKELLPLAESFNKEALNFFINSTEVKAIRIYYGMSEDLQMHAILVGVNDQNEDILPAEGVVTNSTDPVILEDGIRCPPICSVNPL